MFLRGKKGDIVLQQVVLIVIAVAMILIVTSFGSKIWKSFFSSEDKSTEDSFNAFYSIINLKTATTQSYSMTPASLYLGKDYCVVYFYNSNPEVSYIKISEGMFDNTKDIKTYYKPTICKDKSCICLYNDDPETTESDKNENIVSCKEIKNPINIDDKYYDFNGAVCGGSSPYKNYIVIKNTLNQGTSPYLYVLIDNKTNRELTNTLKTNICPVDTTVCSEKKAGEIISPLTDNDYVQHYEQCRSMNIMYSTVEIKCIYDESKKNCKLDCDYGNVADECSTKYKTCDGYNQLIGVSSEKYLTTNIESKDYKYTYMCVNSKDYCSTGPECASYGLNVYAYKNSESGVIPTQELNKILPDSIKEKCLVERITIPSSSTNYYLKSYNTGDEACRNHFEPLFYEQMGIHACIDGKSSECKRYMDETLPKLSDEGYRNDYQLKYINTGDIYWITHISPERYEELKLRFEPISKCSIKVAETATTT